MESVSQYNLSFEKWKVIQTPYISRTDAARIWMKLLLRGEATDVSAVVIFVM